MKMNEFKMTDGDITKGFGLEIPSTVLPGMAAITEMVLTPLKEVALMIIG